MAGHRSKWVFALLVLFMCFNIGCAKSTLEVLKDKAKKNPSNYQAQNNLAFHLTELKRYDEAIEVYDKALEIRPDDFLARNNKGYVLYLMGRYDDALEVFISLAHDNPDKSDVLSNIAMCYHNKKEFARAMYYYKKALEASPKNKPAQDGLNFLYEDIKAMGISEAQISQQIAEFEKQLEEGEKAPAPEEKAPETEGDSE